MFTGRTKIPRSFYPFPNSKFTRLRRLKYRSRLRGRIVVAARFARGYHKFMTQLEARARDFAAEAHLGQLRKYVDQAYISHPEAVAEIVRGVEHTQAMLAAAWLHDVVEDCGVDLDEIRFEFGSEVCGLVADLTDISKPTDGNRKIRKEIDRQHTAMASPAAKTVKLADLIDNSATIVQHDPAFAAVYLREKALLLEVLREGDQELWNRAAHFVMIGSLACHVPPPPPVATATQ